ncbi:hypothetical protein HDU76_008800 [Blyttiomyces sp. JEL0837]|nr:hypothetical protein HDU76_008800 [Blyttiomyces sp. JEL0837]
MPPPRPSLKYHGGPVLSNVQVFGLLWGGNNYQAGDIKWFYDAIAGNSWIDLMAEYNTSTQQIGSGYSVGTYVETDNVVRHLSTWDYLAPYLRYYISDIPRLIYFGAYQGPTSRCMVQCSYDHNYKDNINAIASAVLANAITNPATPPAWYETYVGVKVEVADYCSSLRSTTAGYYRDPNTITPLWSNKNMTCMNPKDPGNVSTGQGSPQPTPDLNSCHDICTVGKPLNRDCNACTQLVVDFDSKCGTDAWDMRCIALAEQRCKTSCPFILPNSTRQGRWQAMGCLRTTDYPDFPPTFSNKIWNRYKNNGSLWDLDACLSEAKGYGYNYVGLSNGGINGAGECWADNAFRNLTVADAPVSDCKTGCVGGSCHSYNIKRLTAFKFIESPQASPTLQTTATATAKTTPYPLVNGKWLSLGCFKDSDRRILSTKLTNRPDGYDYTFDLFKCLNVAGAMGFTYAGVEAGGQCWADTAMRNLSNLDTVLSGCDIPCATESADPVINTPHQDWKSIGCYQTGKGAGGRFTLGTQLFDARLNSSSQWNDDTCLAVALAYGYQFAGLQGGGQCWVGTQLDIVGPVAAPASDCMWPCDSNNAQYCGGNWTLSVYNCIGPSPTPFIVYPPPNTAIMKTTTRTSTTTIKKSTTTTIRSTINPSPLLFPSPSVELGIQLVVYTMCLNVAAAYGFTLAGLGNGGLW